MMESGARGGGKPRPQAGAARKLGLDRRTVKAKVDEALLAALQGGAESVRS